MSEIENTTADIDNNAQRKTKETPSKRLTNAERALRESEQLVKALGGSLEGGRRTRSSARGTPAPSPKIEEPVKRKALSTPRRPKKAKKETIDVPDSGNHVGETKQAESVEVPVAQTSKSDKPETKAEETSEKANEAPAEPEKLPIESNEAEQAPVELNEVDESPIESNDNQSKNKMEVETIEQTPELNETVPSKQPIDEPITIDEDSPEESNKTTTTPQVEESPSVSADADTTTVILIEEDSRDDTSLVELVQEDQEVTKNESPKIEEIATEIIEDSSNEAQQNEPSQSTAASDEPIAIVEIVEEETPTINESQEVVEILPVENDTNSNQVNSTENGKSIVEPAKNEAIPQNIDTAQNVERVEIPIAANEPMEQTITTSSTSETIVEPTLATV